MGATLSDFISLPPRSCSGKLSDTQQTCASVALGRLHSEMKWDRVSDNVAALVPEGLE